MERFINTARFPHNKERMKMSDTVYTIVKFYSPPGGQINRRGLPEGVQIFGETHDLDWICQQAGGVKLGIERSYFSPLSGGKLWTRETTVHLVGNAIVANSSEGYPNERRTTLIVEGEKTNTDIADEFELYYGAKPEIESIAGSLNLIGRLLVQSLGREVIKPGEGIQGMW